MNISVNTKMILTQQVYIVKDCSGFLSMEYSQAMDKNLNEYLISKNIFMEVMMFLQQVILTLKVLYLMIRLKIS
jgi:hypothetical protein